MQAFTFFKAPFSLLCTLANAAPMQWRRSQPSAAFSCAVCVCWRKTWRALEISNRPLANPSRTRCARSP